MRAKYPGSSAIEYENIIQIFITVLIGWDKETQKGKGGIFGNHRHMQIVVKIKQYLHYTHIFLYGLKISMIPATYYFMRMK